MTPMNKSTPRRQRPCPRCGRPSRPDSFPFCSERCRLTDLSGWFGETYGIPAEETDDEQGEDETHRPPTKGAGDFLFRPM
jgi:endogenous inhibitor of DNA gyrase (YacG/DUF329 family)